MRIVALSLDKAQAMVIEHHRHHRKPRGHLFSIGVMGPESPTSLREVLLGAVIVGRPVAQGLQDGVTWEVTRLACTGHENARHAASKLLAAAATSSFARGIARLVSYTRKDEDGTCYRAAGWIEVAEVKARGWDSGNKEQRWLPGLYEPTTEIVDRIRWEKRPHEAIMAVVKMISALGRFAVAWGKVRARAA